MKILSLSAVVIGAILAAFGAQATSGADVCTIRSDVPCLHVKKCSSASPTTIVGFKKSTVRKFSTII